MRLWRLTLTLFSLMTVLVAIFTLAGRAQPPSVISALFNNSDGSPCKMPCMFGLIPGQTKTWEILQIIESHPFLRGLARTEGSLPPGRWYEFSDHTQRITLISDKSSTIQSIIWQNNSCSPAWLPTVGDLIVALGTPTVAYVQPFRFGATGYSYSKYHLQIESNRESMRMASECKNFVGYPELSPQDLITGIFLGNPDYYERGAVWRGFRQAQFYFTQ